MSTPILRISALTKSYIIGPEKNARKVQREIEKLAQKAEKGGSDAEAWRTLRRAQELFAEEKYPESHELLTGRRLKPRKERGVVVHALRGIDLEINQGESVAIMGPSGSGKSTLLNMMGLLDRPTSGQILIKGENVTAIKRRDLPSLRSGELGFVFQAFNLVTTLTALENVMLPLRYAGVGMRERRKLAQEALERVGLGDRMEHLPNELSGGQQQRVAIARSIVNRPAIVFGDELTGELDSKMTEEVMELVEELNRAGQTIIIVTHNPEVARRCHRIILMRDGRVERDTSSRKQASPL